MKFLLSVTVMMVLYQYSTGQSMLDKCSTQAANKNGAVGYFRHDTDCDKFIQCENNDAGRLEGTIRQCAFSTYWNNDLLTCLPAKGMNCPNDHCQRNLDGMREKADGNCRGYWECVDRKAVAMCCPQGQYFNETYGCMANDESNECKDKCFNDIPIAENETDVEPCNLQAIAGEPSKFNLEIVGFPEPFTMRCPGGTSFNQTMCKCVHVERDDTPTPAPTPTCRREVYLPFDTDARDESGNNNHITNENVIVENGTAFFNGKDSQLIIPRFNNIERVSTIVIKVNYTSNHNKTGVARAIISNSDTCSSNMPSVLLSEDDKHVYFGVGTTHSTLVYAYLPHEEDSDMGDTDKSIVYKYNGSKLFGSDGINTTEENISGFLRNVHCSIHVGYASDLARFEGDIDELEIYLCDPDM